MLAEEQIGGDETAVVVLRQAGAFHVAINVAVACVLIEGVASAHTWALHFTEIGDPLRRKSDHVCKRHLRHVPCRPGRVRRPRAETRPETVNVRIVLSLSAAP